MWEYKVKINHGIKGNGCLGGTLEDPEVFSNLFILSLVLVILVAQAVAFIPPWCQGIRLGSLNSCPHVGTLLFYYLQDKFLKTFSGFLKIYIDRKYFFAEKTLIFYWFRELAEITFKGSDDKPLCLGDKRHGLGDSVVLFKNKSFKITFPNRTKRLIQNTL